MCYNFNYLSLSTYFLNFSCFFYSAFYSNLSSNQTHNASQTPTQLPYTPPQPFSETGSGQPWGRFHRCGGDLNPVSEIGKLKRTSQREHFRMAAGQGVWRNSV